MGYLGGFLDLDSIDIAVDCVGPVERHGVVFYPEVRFVDLDFGEVILRVKFIS